MDQIDEGVDNDEFNRHSDRFFAMIGHCVTLYQSVEDVLESVFAVAISGSELKAKAIFKIARGLDAKINLISAALLDEPEKKQRKWASFSPRLYSAFEMRNQLAHARTVHNGGTFTIVLSKDPNLPDRVVQLDAPRMELRKISKKGETIWTEPMMRNEYQKLDDLFRHLIGFTLEIQGKEVPEHLKDDDQDSRD